VPSVTTQICTEDAYVFDEIRCESWPSTFTISPLRIQMKIVRLIAPVRSSISGHESLQIF
jgi:hypothetical protein